MIDTPVDLMPNQFSFTVIAQNTHPASTVTGAVTQQVPNQSIREASLQSAVAAFTSGASNTVAIGASGVVTVSGVTQIDPVLGTNLNVANHRGLYIWCARADSATAPTYTENAKTSTTSLAIGTGSKAFTTAVSQAWVDGTRVRAVSAANHANFMEGTITYATSTVTMTVDTIGGTGTLADWTLYTVPCAQITSTNFGGLTIATALPLVEDSGIFLFHDSVALSNADIWKKKATSGQTLTVSLAGVTGLKVSVLAVGD